MASILLSFLEARNILYHSRAVQLDDNKSTYQYSYIPSEMNDKIELHRFNDVSIFFTKEDNEQVKAGINYLLMKDTAGKLRYLHPLRSITIKDEVRDL